MGREKHQALPGKAAAGRRAGSPKDPARAGEGCVNPGALVWGPQVASNIFPLPGTPVPTRSASSQGLCAPTVLGEQWGTVGNYTTCSSGHLGWWFPHRSLFLLKKFLEEGDGVSCWKVFLPVLVLEVALGRDMSLSAVPGAQTYLIACSQTPDLHPCCIWELGRSKIWRGETREPL